VIIEAIFVPTNQRPFPPAFPTIFVRFKQKVCPVFVDFPQYPRKSFPAVYSILNSKFQEALFSKTDKAIGISGRLTVFS